MDTFLKESLTDFNIVSTVTLFDIMFSLIMSAILNIILAKFYTFTHEGYSYSRSFMNSIVLVGIIIALIMIIIGSNIARAFALVGAMSIIRFRNPVKDSRDLVFIFAAIAIGMACGTQFYQFGAIFLFIFCLLLVSFKYFGFGDISDKNYVIKLRIKTKDRKNLEDLIKLNTIKYSIISIEKSTVSRSEENLILEFELSKNSSHNEFLNKIEEEIKPFSINLLVGESNVNA